VDKRKLHKLEGQPFHAVAAALTDAELIAFYLNGVRGAIMAQSDAQVRAIAAQTKDIGKWLSLIATAASTPQDNSAEVQAEVNKLVAQLDVGTAEVKDAINQQQKGE
jgi:hypothetical protein